MSLPFKQLKAIIWDLDNTWFPYNAAFSQVCHEATVKTVIEDFGIDLSAEIVFDLACQSFKELGHDTRYFLKEYNLDPVEMHVAFHRNLTTQFLEPCEETIIAMTESAQRLEHAILSNASTLFAQRVMMGLKLDHLFDTSNIIGMEENQCLKKHESPLLLERLLDNLGLLPEEVLMVDDQAKNLVIPKEKGMMTALVSNGLEITKPDYADIVVENPLSLLQAYNMEMAA